MMTFLDVCAGIGGFSLGLERAGMTCAGQVEIDDYCNRVLEKHWPGVPRWRDIKALDCTQLPAVDLICGGYPCQPFSLAGKRRGAEDDRHLWPHLFAAVSALRPAWCLFENVAGHISMGLDAVLSDMERGGYAAQPLVIPACAVDAPTGGIECGLLPTLTRKGNWNKRGLTPTSGDGLYTTIGGRPGQSDLEAFMGFPRGWLDI